MRLIRGSLGNLLQDEASCAIYIYSFSVDVQPTKTERAVEMDVDDEWRRYCAMTCHSVCVVEVVVADMTVSNLIITEFQG